MGNDIVSLPNDRSFTKTNAELLIDYNLTSRWNILTGLNYNLSASDDGTYVRKNSNMGDYIIGAQWRAFYHPFEFIPEVKIIIPGKNFDNNTDEVFSGEGVLQALAGFHLQKKISLFNLSTGSFYHYRAEQLAQLIDYYIEGQATLGQIKLSLKALAFDTITKDVQTDTPTVRTNVIDRVNGSSFIYHSINPSYLALNFSAQIQASLQNSFGLGVEQSLNGKNYYYGTTFRVFWQWKSKNEIKRKIKHQRKKTQQRNNSFEESDGSEQLNKEEEKLFEDAEKALEDSDEN